MHVNETIREALFASQLQPSDALTSDKVACALGCTLGRLNAAGCAGHLAEEFGNHPEQAADRMRWIRQLADDMCANLCIPTTASATTSAGTGILPAGPAA